MAFFMLRGIIIQKEKKLLSEHSYFIKELGLKTISLWSSFLTVPQDDCSSFFTSLSVLNTVF